MSKSSRNEARIALNESSSASVGEISFCNVFGAAAFRFFLFDRFFVSVFSSCHRISQQHLLLPNVSADSLNDTQSSCSFRTPNNCTHRTSSAVRPLHYTRLHPAFLLVKIVTNAALTEQIVQQRLCLFLLLRLRI